MCKDQPTEKKRFKWRRSPRPPIPPADRRLSEDSQAPQALCPHCGELFFVYDAPLYQDAVAIPQTMNQHIPDYYAQHSPFTDPGAYNVLRGERGIMILKRLPWPYATKTCGARR